MTHTLAGDRLHAGRDSRAQSVPQPYWNPYLVGILLGLVLLATYAITGRGLGATAAFGAVGAWLASIVAPEHAAASAALAKYYNDGAPLLSWTLFLVVGALISGVLGHRMKWTVERGPQVSVERRLLFAFVGGFVAAYGAKIAKGCTSGQALTGSSILNAGSLVFLAAVFVAGFGLAHIVKKEWL